MGRCHFTQLYPKVLILICRNENIFCDKKMETHFGTILCMLICILVHNIFALSWTSPGYGHNHDQVTLKVVHVHTSSYIRFLLQYMSNTMVKVFRGKWYTKIYSIPKDCIIWFFFIFLICFIMGSESSIKLFVIRSESFNILYVY